MNNIKNVFNIKDLENLSGIKAHTIRIWEKRYNVLSPSRTDTNIRFYNTEDLQKLLNITLLHSYGYKISKVVQMSDAQLLESIRVVTASKMVRTQAINAFKMAMMNFNQRLFIETYDSLLSDKPFREIFYEVFIPLLQEIGLLWQTYTITPAHEHFISHQIRMRLLINTCELQGQSITEKNKVYVLFLPLNEIHELGLLYLNYELSLHDQQTIYLGENIPKENLQDIAKRFSQITFICYTTVVQDSDEITGYFQYVDTEILKKGHSDLWIFGRGSVSINQSKLSSNIRVYDSIKKLTELI
jgi:DNA-binding transcriptional MerR regulator